MRSHFIWKYFRMIFDIYNNFDLTIYNVNKSLFIISNIISPYSKGTNITITYTEKCYFIFLKMWNSTSNLLYLK